MNPTGRLLHFRSAVDGREHPVALCATDDSPAPKPLIVELSPSAHRNLPRAVSQAESLARIAARHGRSCVVLRPTGRGGGSVYQNYGEVDVCEAIEFAASLYAIDRERILLTGASMGGAACWYLVSHYPDRFAAAAPFCGYCDYRLWRKPGGGLAVPMQEWEEPSLRSRSAVFLLENFAHTPVWIVHGEWDRAVGGGVPVEQSRQMARLLAERGFRPTYTEVPKTGHACRSRAGELPGNVPPRLKPPTAPEQERELAELLERVVLWLLDQRKPRDVDHVAFATFGLRHPRSYWVEVGGLARYGERGLVDARFAAPDRLEVRTEGVRAFALGPVRHRGRASVAVDGQELGAANFGGRVEFTAGPDGRWRRGGAAVPGTKRHACSGPIGDLCFDGLVLVPGTTGSDEETFHAATLAGFVPRFFRERNGGVNRGGKDGDNAVELPVIADRDLTAEARGANNLLLLGRPASNAVLARYADRLPLAFADGEIRLAGRTYAAPRVAVFAIFPHPENPARYVAVHGGVTPDAICWGSGLNLQLLPDFLVYAEDRVLEWGFWDHAWQRQS
ncbi:MAG: prolyl oligopeptidase family serine peptidase [Opitutaceae bacterium]|nr:prolyl oligopeptidase family serine peptidase [Opitutaceae bacterium]